MENLMKCFAVCSKGLEPIVSAELSALGAIAVEQGTGGVHFSCDLPKLYEINLWLRSSSRVLVTIREFSAKSTEMLYDQVKRIHWEDWLDVEMTFSVNAIFSGNISPSNRNVQDRNSNERMPLVTARPAVRVRGRSELNNSHYAALKIKDAIVDRLRYKTGARPNVNIENPDVAFHAYFRDGKCTLSLDSSGGSLHERGYRLKQTIAPMKETLAAGIVLMSGWDGKSLFVDPMCGSGTLVIEAALKALNIAPGLFRKKFGFETWKNFDRKVFADVREKALQARLFKLPNPVRGYDQDRRAVAVSIENATQIGLSKFVHFERKGLDELEPSQLGLQASSGTLIVNPPYGERLGEESALVSVYKKMGDVFKHKFKGWNCYVFTGSSVLAKSVGLRTSKRMILFNGPIESRLLEYRMY